MPFILERKRPDFGGPTKRSSGIPKLRLSSALAPVDGMNHASKPKVDPIPVTPLKRIETVDTTRIMQAYQKQPRADQICIEEVTVLELVPFSKQPIVNFGEIQVNHSHTKSVAVRNPNNSQQRLVTSSCPKPDKGFNMDATEFLLAPKTETYIAIEWTPKTVGPCREKITFYDINRHPQRIVLVGLAVPPKPPQTKMSGPRFIRRSNTVVRTRRSPIKTLKTPNLANIKPLTKLNSSSIRRQSGMIVQKMLLKYDNEMALQVQTCWRAVLARRQLEDLKLRVAMVLRVQTYCRMLLAKENILNVVRVQSYFRSVIARRELNDLKSREALIIRLQSYFRMVIAQRQLKLRMAMLIRLQSFFRMILVKRRVEMSLSMITRVQSLFRMVIAERQMKLRLAMTIRLQSHFRMVLAMRHLKSSISMIIQVQTLFRMVLAKRSLKRVLIVVRVQSHFRSVLARKELDELRWRMAIIIRLQTLFRMVIAKRRINVLSSLVKLERIITTARQDWQESTSPAKLERVFLELEQAQRRLDVCL